MRVLVACEFSGTVRDAFTRAGHYAMSCDLLPSETEGPHYQGDVRDVLDDPWDLLVGHPPCTFLTNAASKWLFHPNDTALPVARRRRHPRYPNRWADMKTAAAFFRLLWDAPIPRIALENPVMHGHGRALIGRGHDQTFQPWHFGHGEVKRVCLWLKNLPPLVPTDVVEGRTPRVHRMPPGPDRQKERSRFFCGIADAMAAQWGSLSATHSGNASPS
jgi:hypothetical protein